MEYIQDLETFLKDFTHTCKSVQKKSFKKNQTITTYIQKRNQICILLSGEADLDLALKSLPIDIRFVGDDYKNKDFTGKHTCEARGIQIFYNNRFHGLSSTELRNRIYEAELKKHTSKQENNIKEIKNNG